MVNFIFILSASFILVSPIISEKKSVELILPDSEKKNLGWGEGDGFKYLEILKKMDGKTSESKLKEASLYFKNAIDNFQSLEKLLESKKKEYDLSVHPEDRFDWQKKERKYFQDRELSKILWNGREISNQYLRRGMYAIESIENPRILESEAYKELKAGLYREYIKHQYTMKNYAVAMDMANRYIQIDDKLYNEAEPHRILAVCYEKMEEAAKKTKKFDLASRFKEMKKHHLKTYIKLHYNKDSDEYHSIMDKIIRDY